MSKLKQFLKSLLPSSFLKVEKSTSELKQEIFDLKIEILDLKNHITGLSEWYEKHFQDMKNHVTGHAEWLNSVIDTNHKDLYQVKEELGIVNFHPNIIHNSLLRFTSEFLKLSILAQKMHPSIFSKYKDAFEGKDVYVIGGGPTLDKCKIPEGGIQIGVNGCCFSQNTNLDFYLYKIFMIMNLKYG